MGNTRDSKKRITNGGLTRVSLSVRIAMICFFMAVAAVLGLLRVNQNLHTVTQKYDGMAEQILANTSDMEEISRLLEEHQIIIYHHLTEADAEARNRLEEEAQEIENDMVDLLKSFAFRMNGSSCERYYHNIYSGLVGYFNNVEVIFSFNDRGDIRTAGYYMQITLEENIRNVNSNLDEMGGVLERAMRVAKQEAEMNVVRSGMEATIIIAMVIIFSCLCIFSCVRIADEVSSRDLLTGVYNHDRLVNYAGKLERSGKLKDFSSIALSIRNFKFINQEYGSATGDEVLVQYASQLQTLLEKGDMLARYGGDNFILVIRKEHVKDFLAGLDGLSAHIVTENGDFSMPVYSRCGIYEAREHGTASNMLDACQVALSATRKANSENVVYFRNVMYEKLHAKKKTLDEFEKAIKNHDFTAYYQPKVDMRSGKLCGSEALARWVKDGKVVPPDSFIPFLEEEGILPELDFYIFETVCKDIKAWKDAGIETVRVSSNFSKLHLKNIDFAADVLGIMDRIGVDGSSVEIELTESTGYEDYDAVTKFIAEMHKHGITVAIDDFGTGYSSLSMLKDLNVDVVKLDRSFLFGVGRDENDEAKEKMIVNIVKMIGDLGKSVICEGVEKKEQVELLLSAGCSFAQGFYYDRPLTQASYADRLKNPDYDK